MESDKHRNVCLNHYNHLSIIMLAVLGYFDEDNVKIFHMIYNADEQESLTTMYRSAMELAIKVGNENFLHGFLKHKQELVLRIISPFSVVMGVQSGLSEDLLNSLLSMWI